MNLTKFDKPTLRLITADMTAALQAVAQKHGIQVSYKGCSFFDTNATFKFEGAIVSQNGTVDTKERVDYTRYAGQFGLRAEWLDQTFNSNGKTMKIIGLCVRRSKNPVLAEDTATHKHYIFSDSYIKLVMENQASKKPVGV